MFYSVYGLMAIGIFGNFNFLIFAVGLSLSLELRHRVHICDYGVIFSLKNSRFFSARENNACVFDPSLVKYLRIDITGAFVLKENWGFPRSYQIDHKGSKSTNQITSCTLVVFRLKNGMFPHRFANSSLHVFPLTHC